jgi:hypothetical protein
VWPSLITTVNDFLMEFVFSILTDLDISRIRGPHSQRSVSFPLSMKLQLPPSHLGSAGKGRVTAQNTNLAEEAISEIHRVYKCFFLNRYCYVAPAGFNLPDSVSQVLGLHMCFDSFNSLK